MSTWEDAPALTFHEGCVGAAVVVKVSAVWVVQAVVSQALSVAETLQDAVHETLGEKKHHKTSCQRTTPNLSPTSVIHAQKGHNILLLLYIIFQSGIRCLGSTWFLREEIIRNTAAVLEADDGAEHVQLSSHVHMFGKTRTTRGRAGGLPGTLIGLPCPHTHTCTS